MFLVDHNPYDVNPVLSLSYEHHSEEMIVATDDQDLITRGIRKSSVFKQRDIHG
jgi:hypothetical protein